MRLSAKLKGKYVKLTWLDITTHSRVKLSEVVMTECKLNGKVIRVSPHLIIEHDTCGILGDYTILHPSNVVDIQVI